MSTLESAIINIRQGDRPLADFFMVRPVNLHHLTFEDILDICAVLEGPEDLKDMVESLVLLENNIRYLRVSLEGKRLQDQSRSSERSRLQREIRKKNLRILGSKDSEREEER